MDTNHIQQLVQVIGEVKRLYLIQHLLKHFY